ncbi:uncharacterized protein BYT42DRAFT_549498 [Radiomyces spectabilis]|uniref:uncharacterized protein n=1 Tax=Radiomyces spectabilis TaxID=64574 RepID=UPI00222122E4|nr:uncharacterized protein BYT42DRAFT_549498 [Radiomyces spectabilis]KAI8368326.1 hypothetical protein BYT42DRAFT_549498 [Radiomyces spectabilis]
MVRGGADVGSINEVLLLVYGCGFKKQFVGDQEDRWWTQLQELCQGPRQSVDDVAVKLEELFMLLDIKSQSFRVRTFLGAIKKEITFEVEKDGLPRNLEEAKAKAKRIEVIVKKYDSHGFPGGYEGNSLASFERSELESARSTIELLTEKLEHLQKPMKTSTGGEVKLVDTVHDEVKSLVSANEVQNVKRRAEAPPMVTAAERPQVQRKKVAHPEEENRIEVAPVGLSSAPVIPQVDKGKAPVDAVVQDQVVRRRKKKRASERNKINIVGAVEQEGSSADETFAEEEVADDATSSLETISASSVDKGESEDTVAATSRCQGLADYLGLVPNGDRLKLVGFDHDPKKDLSGVDSDVVMDVPICVAGKVRPEHMCVRRGAEDCLCLLGIPWFQEYGIEINLMDSTIVVPTLDGSVKLQGYMTKVPGRMVGVPPVMPGVVLDQDSKLHEAREVYLAKAGDKHMVSYQDDLLPAKDLGESRAEEVKFDATNITLGVPTPLVKVMR